MSLTDTALPFGLRQVVLTPINDDETLGSAVRLPVSRTFTFAEAEDFEQLRGDDRLITTRGTGPSVNWDLEAGGITLEAWKVLSGGRVTEDGLEGEDLRRTFRKGAYDNRPLFQVEGRAISDSGGDFHAVIFRCRATGDLSGEMSDGSFWLTSASGEAFPSEQHPTDNGDPSLYEFVQNETATAISEGSGD